MEKYPSLEAFFEERLALDLLHSIDGTYYIAPEQRLKKAIRKKLNKSGFSPLQAETQYLKLKHKSISLEILQREVKLLDIPEDMEKFKELVPSLKTEKPRTQNLVHRNPSKLRIPKKAYSDFNDFETDLEILIRLSATNQRADSYPKKTRQIACKALAERCSKIQQKHLRKAYEMLMRRKGKAPNLSYVG